MKKPLHYFLANLFVFIGFSINAILLREINPIDNSRVALSPEIMIITALIGGLLGIAFIGFDIKFLSRISFIRNFITIKNTPECISVGSQFIYLTSSLGCCL